MLSLCRYVEWITWACIWDRVDIKNDAYAANDVVRGFILIFLFMRVLWASHKEYVWDEVYIKHDAYATNVVILEFILMLLKADISKAHNNKGHKRQLY